MTDLLWWHRVGQLVVCIDDSPVPNPDHPLLVLHGIYDIAEVHTSRKVCLGMAQHFRGIVTFGNGRRGPFYPLFEAARFRPVAPTSIESLRALLVPQRETEVA